MLKLCNDPLFGSPIGHCFGPILILQFTIWPIGSGFRRPKFIIKFYFLRKKFWRDLYRQMYSEYFPSFVERTNFQPCSFTSVFGLPSYAGLYYRKLWAEVLRGTIKYEFLSKLLKMLALDVHGTFAKEGNEAATGQRLRTEWLNEGSLELQSELYQKFQVKHWVDFLKSYIF